MNDRIRPNLRHCRPTGASPKPVVDGDTRRLQHERMKFGRILFVTLMMVGHPAFAQTKSEIAGRMTPAVHACESAPENGGTLQQAICYKDEAARQDKLLNDTWARVTSGLPKIEMKALRIKERVWIGERDKECQSEKSYYINSTAAYMYNLCMVREDIRRTLWLERGGHGPFAIPKQSGA